MTGIVFAYFKMSGSTWKVRGAAVSLALLSALLVAARSPMVGQAGNFWESADSSVGSRGTGASFTTWTHWAVPENPQNPCTFCGGNSYGFANQAAWLEDYNRCCIDSIEVGIFTGYAYQGVNGGWDVGMRPYYTTDDGYYQVNARASYDLHQGSPAWAASNYGTPTYIRVEDNAGVNWVQSFSYTMSCYPATNCLNHAQGETLYGDDWMAGGGDVMSMYYLGSSGYNPWGTETCYPQYNPPGPDDYWVACKVGGTPYKWEPGGSGNGIFGSS